MNLPRLLALLALPALACSLTAPAPAVTPETGPSSPSVAAWPTAGPPTITSAPSSNPTTPPTQPAPALPRCSVATGIPAGRLNLRACAGIDCAVIGVASEGEELQALATLPGWTQTPAGWASSRFLSCEEP